MAGLKKNQTGKKEKDRVRSLSRTLAVPGRCHQPAGVLANQREKKPPNREESERKGIK